MSQILREPMDKQTELMLKYGPKETTYAALYDKKDVPLFRKISEKINAESGQHSKTAEYFFDQLERKWNDHDSDIPFWQISRTEDIPTIQGLAYVCKQIISTGFLPWRYMGAGSDNREARCYQQTLYAEVTPRIDITLPGNGSISRVNQSMRFTGNFPISFPTLTVRESGIFNVTDSSGTMLNRSMFASTPINHTSGVSAFVLATLINFSSVTNWG